MSGVTDVTAAALRFAAAAVLAWPTAAAAQPAAPINTDRPSFTSAARVVGERTIQIETGVAFGRDRVERDVIGAVTSSTLSLPNTLVRIGLTRQVELRIETEGWRRIDNDAPFGDPTSSMSDINVGLEYQFAAQDGVGADLAVIAGTSVPTGNGITPGRIDPFVRLVWGRALGGTTSLGGTFNWSAPSSFEVGRVRTLEASVVAALTLGGAWSPFAEAVVRHQDVGDAAAEWTGNAGLLRTLGDDVQLDVWFGRGLNDAAPDWTIGAGVSWRLHR